MRQLQFAKVNTSEIYSHRIKNFLICISEESRPKLELYISTRALTLSEGLVSKIATLTIGKHLVSVSLPLSLANTVHSRSGD